MPVSGKGRTLRSQWYESNRWPSRGVRNLYKHQIFGDLNTAGSDIWIDYFWTTGQQTVAITGLGSASSFGTPTPNNILVLLGLASASSFGIVTAFSGTIVGLNSQSSFGIPTVLGGAGDPGTFNPAVLGGRHRR